MQFQERPPSAFSLTAMLTVSVAMLAAGALSMVFSFSIGQTLVIWAPAGLALYAVVAAPRSALAGVALGTFVLAVAAQWLRFPSFSPVFAVLPALAGVGSATIRALLGMWLLRRFRAFPYAPSDFRSVGLFVLIGVALLSLIGAILAISTLLAVGLMGRDEAASVGVVIWSAEALGIMIFTPIFVFAHDAPKGSRLRNSAPVIAAGFLSLAAVSAVYTQDTRAQWAAISRDVDDLASELAGRIDTTLKLGGNAVGGVAAIFEGDAERNKADFDAAAKRAVAFGLGIQAIEWIQRVPSADFAAFEARMSQQWGRDFKIFERQNERLIPASGRPAYFPVDYIYPFRGNEGALGFDFASNPDRKAALVAAMESAGAVATPSIRLAQNGKLSVLLFLPVFGPLENHTEENVRGFAIGVFSISGLLDVALKGRAATDIDYWIVDETDPQMPIIMTSNSRELPHSFQRSRSLAPNLLFAEPHWGSRTGIDFGHRKWVLQLAPRESFVASRFNKNAYLILIGGVLITALVCGATMVASDRQKELVADREKALADQKFALDQHAIVSIADADGRLRYVNDRFCRISGYPREKLLGATHQILKSGFQSSHFYRDLWHTILEGRVWRGELCNHDASGKTFWLQTTIVPLKGRDGRISQLISISTDISALKALQASLRSSEQRLNIALSASSTGLWDYDPNTDQAFFSDTWFAILGYKPGSLPSTGATLQSLIHPDDIDRYREAFALHAREASEAIDVEFRLRRENGDWIWIKSVGKAIERDANGAPTRLIGIHRDIANTRAEKAAIAAARDAADQANRSKTDFLATMSHEIRTPMNGVIGMISLLDDTVLTQEQKHYVHTIRQSGEALLSLIDDILDFSKLEAGRVEIERRAFSPVSIVENVLDILEPVGLRKGLRMEMDLCGDIAGQALGDPTRLRQILLNLAGNAVKFTAQGRILIRLIGLADDRLRFEVHDTGIGIAATKHDRLFQVFSQVDPSITRKYGGSGLGLAISKRMVEAMGGKIDFDSQEGQGSVFWFETPIGPLTAAPRPKQQRSIALFCSAERDREAAEHILTQCGFELVDPQAAALAVADAEQAETAAVRSLVASGKTLIVFGVDGPFAGAPSGLVIRGALTPARIARTLVVEAQSSKTSPMGASAAALDSPQLDILIVEDTLTNREVLGGLLRRMGHRVEMAENGLQGLQMVETRDYSLVFMDIQMPEMDGFEATRRIRALSPSRASLPIVAMTANAFPSDIEACFNAGMDEYLSKPVDRKKLAEILDKAVRLLGQELPMA